MKYCAKCGYKLPDTARFCTQCGYVFAGSPTSYVSFQAPSAAGEYLLADISPESLDTKNEKPEAVLTPVRSVLQLLRSMFTGVIRLFTTPRNLIAAVIFIVLWIVINMLRKNTSLPMEIPTLLTYAQGGTDRSNIFGIIGGILGKGVVLAFFLSLINGGLSRTGKGIKSLFSKTGSKISIVSLIIGTVISALTYFLLAGFTRASVFTVMVGISGALLAVQSAGGSGAFYRMIRSVTSKGSGDKRAVSTGRIRGLFSGLVLGFVIASLISVLLPARLVRADEADDEGHWELVNTESEIADSNADFDYGAGSVTMHRDPAGDGTYNQVYRFYYEGPSLSETYLPGSTGTFECSTSVDQFKMRYPYSNVPSPLEWNYTAEDGLMHLTMSVDSDESSSAGSLIETDRLDICMNFDNPFINGSAGDEYGTMWVRGSGYVGGYIYYQYTIPEGHPGDTMTITRVCHYGDITTSWIYRWVEPGEAVPTGSEGDIEEDVFTPAEDEPGEDKGTDIISDIVDGIRNSGLPGAAITAAGGALASGLITGASDEEEKKKKKTKEKKPSGYRMYVNKNFGNTLRRGAEAKWVYARIAELPPEGGEFSRDDLSSQIDVFSGDGVLSVSDGGMVNGYRAAIVKVPDDCTANEGCVSFRFAGKGGTFTRHVIFSITAGEILFPQENLALPACKLKYVRKSPDSGSRIGDGIYVMPFLVKDMPRESKVSGVIERIGATDMKGNYVDKKMINKPMPYKLALERDKEYGEHGIYNAIISEVADYELEAGISEGYALKITAEYGTAGTPGYEKIEGTLPIYRIHMGLALSVQTRSIPCYSKLKPGRDKKNKDQLEARDFELIYSEAQLMLFLCDERDLSIVRIPVIPERNVKVTATRVANERYCKIGDANKDHQKLVESLGISAFPTSEINDNGSRQIRLCSTAGWMDPPTRILADIEVTAKFEDKTYTVVKNVLLRSQEFRVAQNADDERRFLEKDKHVTEQLLRISEKIDHEYPRNLFALKNMIDRMLEGYDYRFGYDGNQLDNVMNMWVGFLEGSFAGANGTPQGVTFADELAAVYAFMQGLRDNTGFLGRVAMGVMTSGISEYIFSAMTIVEKIQVGVYSCKGDKDFGFWDGMYIGIEEYAKQKLMEMAFQKGMSLIGNTYLAPNFTIADKLRLIGKNCHKAINAADRYMKSNSKLYKMGDDALQSCKNFFNSSAGSAKSAIDDTIRGEAEAEARVEQLLKRDRRSLTAEELKELQFHERGMERGIQKVRDLYDIQREMNSTSDPVRLKQLKSKYRDVANEVWKDKYALRQLQRIKHTDGDSIRAQFNNYRETLLDDAQLEALDDVSAETGILRENLYVSNVSNGSKVKYKTGKKVPSDRDVSFKQKVLSDRTRDLTIDQSIGQRAMARRLFRKIHGRDAESIDEALRFMEEMDVTYVHPEGDSGSSYVFEHNLEGYEDLTGMIGIKPDGSMDKSLLKGDLHNKTINQASVRHKGDEWFGKAKDSSRRADVLEAEAGALTGEAHDAMLARADELRCTAQSEYIEGVYQITKQVENIIIPRGVMRKGMNPLPPKAMEIHKLALRVGYDVSPAKFKAILRDEYGMTLNGYAEYMSKFLD
ncbi:zinc-ribbon domain-containing protein [Ruminococcaceae bacterium YRB3002]|nr:zinc-ribbon domain-containing protein [Ruminococcaceae bacterium YRB3002]